MSTTKEICQIPPDFVVKFKPLILLKLPHRRGCPSTVGTRSLQLFGGGSLEATVNLIRIESQTEFQTPLSKILSEVLAGSSEHPPGSLPFSPAWT